MKKESRYRQIRRILWRKFFRGIFLRWFNPGRYLIEKKIFPKIKNKKVLLVGCADYTEWYPSVLEKQKNDVYSIDLDSAVSKFGAKKHVVGNAIFLSKYFKKNFFDVIFFGGIFGYGLDEIKDAEKAMKNIYTILADNGRLIIWWNDTPQRRKVNPALLKSYSLFGEYTPPLRTRQNVVFLFLKK
jgi:SAM-dependent methyltransferase